MNRSILGVFLGVIAIATIAPGASVSEAAVKALSAPLTQASAYAGANVGRLDTIQSDAIRSYSLTDSRVIGGGAFGYNSKYRQVACIKVGHRLSC